MSDEASVARGEEARRNARALDRIGKSAALTQAFRLEPALYDLVRRVNAIVALENRDVAYNQFKGEVIQLVGREATRPELRTSQHYEALLHLLALLLSWQPEQPRTPEIEEEEDLGEEARIDAVVRQAMEASREASLQAFRPPVERQQQ